MLSIHEDSITTDRIATLCKNEVEVYTLRTDKIHPVVSGNKWFKLKFYFQQALSQNAKTIVTFGGAYSNHIVATAYACKLKGLRSIGIIRGEEPKSYSHTLTDAMNYGMQLHFISRENYKRKVVPIELVSPENFFIPEGGYGPLGAAGMATLNYDKTKFNTACCSIGSGTMMAGLINSKLKSSEILGISILKNNYELNGDVYRLLMDKNEPVNIIHDYHFGGYAKYNDGLIRFMNSFYESTGIPTDFVYSAKLFFAINDLINKEYFKPGSKLLIIHCGGLQGNFSLPKGTLIF